MDPSGSAELVESTLPGQGNRESACTVANIGSFFESFFSGQSRDPFRKWFEEKIGFEGEASYRSFHNEPVLVGIDTSSAGAHRDSELRGGAWRIAKSALADSAGTPP